MLGNKTIVNEALSYGENNCFIEINGGSPEDIIKILEHLTKCSLEELHKFNGVCQSNSPMLTGDKVEINAKTAFSRNNNSLKINLFPLPANATSNFSPQTNLTPVTNSDMKYERTSNMEFNYKGIYKYSLYVGECQNQFNKESPRAKIILDMKESDKLPEKFKGTKYYNQETKLVDCSKINLSNQTLCNRNFKCGIFKLSNLTNATLCNTKFKNTYLEDADLTGTAAKGIKEKQLCSSRFFRVWVNVNDHATQQLLLQTFQRKEERLLDIVEQFKNILAHYPDADNLLDNIKNGKNWRHLKIYCKYLEYQEEIDKMFNENNIQKLVL